MKKASNRRCVAPIDDLLHDVAQRTERIWLRRGNIVTALQKALRDYRAKIVKVRMR